MTLDKLKRQSRMRDDIFMARLVAHDQGPLIVDFPFEEVLECKIGTSNFNENATVIDKLSSII